METLKIDFKKEKTGEIELICDFLNRGKVVAYPTETVYGLGCLATNVNAVKKVHKIKRSPINKPLIVLVKSYCQLHDICYVSAKQDKYIRSVWPRTTRDAQNPKYTQKERPTTFILRSRGVLPGIVSGNEDSIAARLPVANISKDFLKNQILIKIILVLL